jgi:hypothetical protein
MGYSARTTEWRYTEWAEWDGATLSPKWMPENKLTDPASLLELYDHRQDTGTGPEMWNLFENENVAAANPSVVKALSAKIRAFYAKMSVYQEPFFVDGLGA